MFFDPNNFAVYLVGILGLIVTVTMSIEAYKQKRGRDFIIMCAFVNTVWALGCIFWPQIPHWVIGIGFLWWMGNLVSYAEIEDQPPDNILYRIGEGLSILAYYGNTGFPTMIEGELWVEDVQASDVDKSDQIVMSHLGWQVYNNKYYYTG